MIRIWYHGNCPDGFGAAWAAWRHFREEAEYTPVVYGQAPPASDPGDDIFLVDYSLPKREIIGLRAGDRHVTVIDHHKSAFEDIGDLPGTVFDMERSGAMLTWAQFHRDPAPALIRYVQDHDLWRFQLPQSRQVRAWLRSYKQDFKLWETIAAQLEYYPASVWEEGKAILRYQNQLVQTMADQAEEVYADNAQREPVLVPVVNATVLFSEVGEELNTRFPEAAYSMYYFDRADGMRQYGLRTKRDDTDVSAVARVYGGGGHKGAAGFTKVLQTGPLL